LLLRHFFLCLVQSTSTAMAVENEKDAFARTAGCNSSELGSECGADLGGAWEYGPCQEGGADCKARLPRWAGCPGNNEASGPEGTLSRQVSPAQTRQVVLAADPITHQHLRRVTQLEDRCMVGGAFRKAPSKGQVPKGNGKNCTAVFFMTCASFAFFKG
uniref:Uncharacterized protein n=1 Tax=Varanus komodoensis TaxID=61221 RepID=A0A8D2ITL9_VARKO